MRAPWLAATLAALAALSAVHVAGDHPQDRLDTAWAHLLRTVEVTEVDQGGFAATSRAADGGDLLRVSYDAVAGHLRVAYEPTQTNLTPMQLDLDLHALVEFEDLDGDGRLSLGDPLVQQVRLEGLRYMEFDARRADGFHNITYRYPLPPAYTGNLIVSFLLPENASAVANRSTAAVHVEHRLRGFAFQGSDSLVALHTRLTSDLGVRVTSGAVESATSHQAGLYAWEQSVADGNGTQDLGVTAQPYGPGGGEALVVFAYGHGADVRHGLSLGVERILPPAPLPAAAPVEARPTFIEGEWRVYLPALVLVMVGLGATVYWRVRQAQQRGY